MCFEWCGFLIKLVHEMSFQLVYVQYLLNYFLWESSAELPNWIKSQFRFRGLLSTTSQVRGTLVMEGVW